MLVAGCWANILTSPAVENVSGNKIGAIMHLLDVVHLEEDLEQVHSSFSQWMLAPSILLISFSP